MKKEVLRSCFVCRNLFNKADLLRIVKNKDNEIFVDKTQKANGRGAYICRNENCIKSIQKEKVLYRAFKCAISQEIINQICEELVGHQ